MTVLKPILIPAAITVGVVWTLSVAWLARLYWCFRQEEKQRKAWAREGRL